MNDIAPRPQGLSHRQSLRHHLPICLTTLKVPSAAMLNFLGFSDDLTELVDRVRDVCAGAMAPGDDSSWRRRRITPSWYGRRDDGAAVDWCADQRGLTDGVDSLHSIVRMPLSPSCLTISPC